MTSMKMMMMDTKMNFECLVRTGIDTYIHDRLVLILHSFLRSVYTIRIGFSTTCWLSRTYLYLEAEVEEDGFGLG